MKDQVLFLILALLMHTGAYAGATPESQKSFLNSNFSVFTERQEDCLRALIHHPATKTLYPNLVTERNLKHEKLLTELDKFCSCKAKKDVPRFKKKKKEPIAHRFRDKSQEYEQEDQCATTHLTKEGLSLNYIVKVTTVFHDDLLNRLEDRTPGSVKMLAKDDHYYDHIDCIHQSIMQKCTKIESLRHTYKCIITTSTSPDSMDELLNYCPGLGGELPAITENSMTYPRI